MDQDFTIALSVPDFIPGKLSREIRPALPDIRLSTDEINSQRMRGKLQVVTSTGVRRRDIMGRIKRTRGWGHQTMRSESSRSRAQQKDNLLRQNSNPRGLISTRLNTQADKTISTRSHSTQNLVMADEATDTASAILESIANENDSDGSDGSEDDIEIQDENALEFIEADSSEHDDEFPDIPSDVEVDD